MEFLECLCLLLSECRSGAEILCTRVYSLISGKKGPSKFYIVHVHVYCAYNYILHATCYMLHVYNSKVKLKVEFSVGLKTCHFIVLWLILKIYTITYAVYVLYAYQISILSTACSDVVLSTVPSQQFIENLNQ